MGSFSLLNSLERQLSTSYFIPSSSTDHVKKLAIQHIFVERRNQRRREGRIKRGGKGKISSSLQQAIINNFIGGGVSAL